MSSSDVKGLLNVSSHTKSERLQVGHADSRRDKTHLGRVKPQVATTSQTEKLDQEKARLRKATNEFESLFIYEMLKTMRKTIPQDSPSGKASFSNDLGKDTYTQLFDMELARKMANGRDGSISAMLYNSLEKVVEAQFQSTGSEAETESSDSRTTEPIELRHHDKSLPLPPFSPMPIERDTQEFVPIKKQSTPGHTDRVIDILDRSGRTRPVSEAKEPLKTIR
jgi:flagellar protein FlgJ